MKTQEGILQRDVLTFNKEYPLNKVLNRPLLKKPKYLQKVVLKWVEDVYYDAYVLGVNGGDMSSSMPQSMWGDQIKLFIVPGRGRNVMAGVRELWLTDIGIGKTKAEADQSFCKHDWFGRYKNQIQNDRFWSTEMSELRNKDEYND